MLHFTVYCSQKLNQIATFYCICWICIFHFSSMKLWFLDLIQGVIRFLQCLGYFLIWSRVTTYWIDKNVNGMQLKENQVQSIQYLFRSSKYLTTYTTLDSSQSRANPLPFPPLVSGNNSRWTLGVTPPLAIITSLKSSINSSSAPTAACMFFGVIRFFCLLLVSSPASSNT